MRLASASPSDSGTLRRRERLDAWTAQDWLRRNVQSALDYVQNPDTFVFHITNPIGNFIVQYGLVPLKSFFVETPWPAMLFGLDADRVPDLGPAPGDRGRALLALIGVTNEWLPAMDTLSQVLVATVADDVVGIPLGVLAAESAASRR